MKKNKTIMTFGDIQELMRPLPIYLPTGNYQKRYIQEYLYNAEKDIYIKARKIDTHTQKIASHDLFKYRIEALGIEK